MSVEHEAQAAIEHEAQAAVEREAQAAASERLARGAVSRRTLLRAGWAAPVILTVAPGVAFAASGTPGGTTTTVPPTGGRTPTTRSSTPSGEQTGRSGIAPTGAAAPGEIPEQQSEGPRPARVTRGFTG